MRCGTEVARFAALLADRTRAEVCLALLDGRAWTGRELARHTGVAPSTISEHLNRLVAGGLVAHRREGRHRYVQLANVDIAELLEHLAAHVNPTIEKPATLRAANVSSALANGRTCYDHLAGRLGVAITDAMIANGLLDLDTGFALTRSGMTWLTSALAVDPAELRPTRRPLVRACLDWTERRSHLAGVVGAHLCRRFQENSWIRRVGTSRAVRLTTAGEQALHQLLGVDGMPMT